MALQVKICDFLENNFKNFDYISVVYGDHLPKNCKGGTFRIIIIIIICALRAQKQYTDLVETCFTGQMDFTVFNIQKPTVVY